MNPQAWYIAKAQLEWQRELGISEAMCETPINRFDAPAKMPAPLQKRPAQPKMPASPSSAIAHNHGIDPVEVAQSAASGAADLAQLKTALADYPHLALKEGARNLVFSDGVAQSDVMIIGEAPGRDEDIKGKPFVGAAGQLLDKMLASIGLDRRENVYISNILPWRPPHNRDPQPDEVAMMMPFVLRHIELAAPKILVLMGNHSCNAILGKKGITKLRGTWHEVQAKQVFPMLHPAYLLRQPLAKRDTWADLLALKDKIAKIRDAQ